MLAVNLIGGWPVYKKWTNCGRSLHGWDSATRLWRYSSDVSECRYGERTECLKSNPRIQDNLDQFVESKSKSLTILILSWISLIGNLSDLDLIQNKQYLSFYKHFSQHDLKELMLIRDMNVFVKDGLQCLMRHHLEYWPNR